MASCSIAFRFGKMIRGEYVKRYQTIVHGKQPNTVRWQKYSHAGLTDPDAFYSERFSFLKFLITGKRGVLRTVDHSYGVEPYILRNGTFMRNPQFDYERSYPVIA